MDNKWVGTSMTIWGGIVSFGAAVLPMVGAAIDASEVNTLQTAGTQVITGVAALAGLIITIIGRYRAGGLAVKG